MKLVSLFSGIGGFEYSMSKFGIECIRMCEIDPAANAVLQQHFHGVPIHKDITEMRSLPRADIVTAGFPCQDLSQAGPKGGITGNRSGLVDHIFRLLESKRNRPRWIILENVSYMLRLQQGAAMEYLVHRIEELGFNWAYRVLDARSFGIPQRRERVVMILSQSEDPSAVLFPQGSIESGIDDSVGHVDLDSLYGFYWTEGKRGLGWTKSAVPTIKGGSGLGIPSPPAIWNPTTKFFGTPTLEDSERMFGFPGGWTAAGAEPSGRQAARWKLIGNSICVPMVDWVTEQVLNPKGLLAETRKLGVNERLPIAAYGKIGERRRVCVSTWAKPAPHPNLKAFLIDDLKPLTIRAGSGFYKRARETTVIRFANGFLDDLEQYIANALAQQS